MHVISKPHFPFATTHSSRCDYRVAVRYTKTTASTHAIEDLFYPCCFAHSVDCPRSKPAETMLEFRTQGFQGYAVKYSPFFDNRLAVAASANYGLVGNGRLYVLELTPGGIQCIKWYVCGPLSVCFANIDLGTQRRTRSMMWLTRRFIQTTC